MDDTEDPKVIAFKKRDDSAENEGRAARNDLTQEEILSVAVEKIAQLNDKMSQDLARVFDGQIAVLREVIIPLMRKAPDDTLEEIAQRLSSEETMHAFGEISLRSSRLWYETLQSIIASRHSGIDPDT